MDTLIDHQEVDNYLRGIGLSGRVVRHVTRMFFLGEIDSPPNDGCILRL